MSKNPNILEASKIPHLYENLENLQIELSKCEKALSDFLETKRLIYPRFYFISSIDLLDILANGNQPKLVSRFVKKKINCNIILKNCLCKFRINIVCYNRITNILMWLKFFWYSKYRYFDYLLNRVKRIYFLFSFQILNW